MRLSNSRQVRALPSHITARLSGQAWALRATRIGIETNSGKSLSVGCGTRSGVGTHAGRPYFFGSTFSTGPPAFFQAPKPPSRCATGVSPMSCAVLVASADRQAPAQKNTNLLPLWK